MRSTPLTWLKHRPNHARPETEKTPSADRSSRKGNPMSHRGRRVEKSLALDPRNYCTTVLVSELKKSRPHVHVPSPIREGNFKEQCGLCPAEQTAVSGRKGSSAVLCPTCHRTHLVPPVRLKKFEYTSSYVSSQTAVQYTLRPGRGRQRPDSPGLSPNLSSSLSSPPPGSATPRRPCVPSGPRRTRVPPPPRAGASSSRF